MKEEEFVREVTFLPAWDKRDPNPNKDYGVHNVELVMVLKHPPTKTAVQFVLFTGWHWLDLDEHGFHRTVRNPCPADLSYHSPKPLYDEQSRAEDDCVLTGGDCYHDGSGLGAYGVYKILLREGSDGVWKHLREYWEATFGGTFT